MGRSFDPGTDVRGNPVVLQGIVICRIVDVESDFVIAYINDRVNGRISVTEFNDEDIRLGVYFEAKIVDFSQAGIPDLVKPEIVPSYDIRPYSYVRAEATFVRKDMIILRINKYRFAKMAVSEIDSNISVGDVVEAEVIKLSDDEGYPWLGWGKIVEKGKTGSPPKQVGMISENKKKDRTNIAASTKYVKKYDTNGMNSDNAQIIKQPEKDLDSAVYRMYEWKSEQSKKQDQSTQSTTPGQVSPIRIHIYRKGEYVLFPFVGKLKKYTEKKLPAKWIPVTVDGKEKVVTVYVDQEEKTIYISHDIYVLFGEVLHESSVLHFK